MNKHIPKELYEKIDNMSKQDRASYKEEVLRKLVEQYPVATPNKYMELATNNIANQLVTKDAKVAIWFSIYLSFISNAGVDADVEVLIDMTDRCFYSFVGKFPGVFDD